jgi:hypothetical protein
MPKTISERVEEVLSDSNTHEYIKDYVAALLDNLQRTEARFQKLTLQLFFLFAAFELLARAVIGEVSLGPFKITDFSLIQKLLPVVIAYTYYEHSAAITMRRFLTETHSNIIKTLHRTFYDNDLDYFLLPSSALRAEEILSKGAQNVGAKLINVLSYLPKAAMLFAPFVFEAYAVYRLFHAFGLKDIIVWVSTVISMLFLLQGFLIALQDTKLVEK